MESMIDLGPYGYQLSDPDDDGVREVLVIRRSDRKIVERCWTVNDALDAITRLESNG